jgi:sRNA-binding regulator protein Hfq
MTQATLINGFQMYAKIEDFPENLRHYVETSEKITVFKHPFN